MTTYQPRLRKCTGTHCEWRDRCKLHGLPASDTRGFIWPIKTAEYCDWFIPVGRALSDFNSV